MYENGEMKLNNKLTVVLEDEDIRQDLNKILESMNAIRVESIARKEIIKQKEYEHLAFRLASCFASLYTDLLKTEVCEIEEMVSSYPYLKSYDRNRFWSYKKSEEKHFVRTLTKLAVKVFLVRNNSEPNEILEKTAEYHLFQALLCLGKLQVKPFRHLPEGPAKLVLKTAGEYGTIFSAVYSNLQDWQDSQHTLSKCGFTAPPEPFVLMSGLHAKLDNVARYNITGYIEFVENYNRKYIEGLNTKEFIQYVDIGE